MLQNDIKKNKNKLNNWSDRGSLLPSYYEMIIMKTFTDSEKTVKHRCTSQILTRTSGYSVIKRLNVQPWPELRSNHI